MPQDLKTLIPPIDEDGRAKRTKAEHKILDRLLKDLDDPELDHADFRGLMRDYCELKKQDNIKEKNLVHLAIAEARLSRLSRRSRLRETPGSAFGDSPIESLDRESTPSIQSTAAPPPDSPSALSEFQLSTFNFQLSPNDPDVDPEWSLAPWGRRKNGRPRTEKEYRTILYRTVRDVYGLDLTESTAKPRPDLAAAAPSPALPPTPDIASLTSAILHPTSEVEHLTSHIPHPTSDKPSSRSPPGSTEVSPFCRADAPFVPKPTNPWYDF